MHWRACNLPVSCIVSNQNMDWKPVWQMMCVSSRRRKYARHFLWAIVKPFLVDNDPNCNQVCVWFSGVRLQRGFVSLLSWKTHTVSWLNNVIVQIWITIITIRLWIRIIAHWLFISKMFSAAQQRLEHMQPESEETTEETFPIRNWGPWVNTFNKIIVIITLNWSDWRRRTWNHNQFPAYALKFCMNLVSRGNPCVWVKTASVITTVTGGHTDTKKGGASCDSDFKKNEKKIILFLLRIFYDVSGRFRRKCPKFRTKCPKFRRKCPELRKKIG